MFVCPIISEPNWGWVFIMTYLLPNPLNLLTSFSNKFKSGFGDEFIIFLKYTNLTVYVGFQFTDMHGQLLDKGSGNYLKVRCNLVKRL